MRAAAAAWLVGGPHAARAPLLHGPQHADHALDAPARERAAAVAEGLHAAPRRLLLQVRSDNLSWGYIALSRFTVRLMRSCLM